MIKNILLLMECLCWIILGYTSVYLILELLRGVI